MKNEIEIGGCAHQAGTCRFGTDPQTSVLDTNCKAHELDNLYVVDTSFFPSIGAVNPALTAMANALRVGEHLVQRLCSGGATRWLSEREIGAVYVAGHGAGRGAGHVPGGQHDLHQPQLLRPVQHGVRGDVLAPGRHTAFASLYGIVETMNGNWATLYMANDLGATTTLASWR